MTLDVCPRAAAALLGCLAVLALAGLLGAIVACGASAESASQAWSIRSLAYPTAFAPGDNSGTDVYKVLVTNSGSLPTDGSPVTVTDVLPAGVTVQSISGFDWTAENQNLPSCTAAPVRCTYNGTMPPGDVLEVKIALATEPGVSGSLTNAASVAGGGADEASTSAENPVARTPPPFAISDFNLAVTGPDGHPASQAGSHPSAITATLDFTTQPVVGNPGIYTPEQNVKDVIVDLPLGLVGDPQAAPKCPLSELNAAESGLVSQCPPSSKIGEVALAEPLGFVSSLFTEFNGKNVTPLYNLQPEPSHPAEFGFIYAGLVSAHLYASVIPTEGGYALRVTAPNIPSEFIVGGPGYVSGFSLTFFGDPIRHTSAGEQEAPFFTYPSACSGQHEVASVHLDTWTKPGRKSPDGTPILDDPSWQTSSVALRSPSGCNQLRLRPSIAVQPDDSRADSPVGPSVDVRVPQQEGGDSTLASPDVRDASITLPAGMSLSPPGADGLQACSAAQFALPGVEMGADEVSRSASGRCPEQAQVGTAEAQTPLLPAHSLNGRLFVAQPLCGGAGQPPCSEADAEDGRLFRLYLELEGLGVNVKLPGFVEAGGHGVHSVLAGLRPGQLRARFPEDPQLPFSDLAVTLKGGSHAALATPQTCGPANTSAELVPWSFPDTLAATVSSQFFVEGCASEMPFAPVFAAGATVPLAGEFSPLTTTLSREDGEQDIAGLSVTLPPGVAAMLAGVPLCGEPQAQRGSCPADTRIGTSNVAAGAGRTPLWLTGAVYLTDPYNGAPFGLSIDVPAKAGPFDLGDVVVRAAVAVDPHTAQVSVRSDPLPQAHDSVPLRLKTINVTIDRSRFVFNPTDCSRLAVSGIASADLPDGSAGAAKIVSSPFEVTGCRHLPFKPKLSAHVQAKTSRSDGARLHVVVISGAGQANIASVRVVLPKALPSRLSTLNHACPEDVFNANPASCPASSVVGFAKARTPVLPVPLTGPAYFVSHGSERFPALVVVLQGYGIVIDLTGETFIAKGITSTTFRRVPDVPITRFDLTLPRGRHSALAAHRKLCKDNLIMPTALTAHNGALVKQKTKIVVDGCRKPVRQRVRKRK